MSDVFSRSLRVLTVIIGLLTLMVNVAKAAFDAGWKISNKEHDKNKKD